MIRSFASRNLRRKRPHDLLLSGRRNPASVSVVFRACAVDDNSRCFSAASDETPKVPPPVASSSSSSLAPIGDGDNLPAKLIDFEVAAKLEGHESMIATVNLRPGETLRAESGNMLYMTEGIEMDTQLSGASSAFSRMMTGQNVFLTDFRYEGEKGTSGTVALGTEFPSKIMRFSLEEFENKSLICQRGAYLASNATVNIEMEFTKSFSAGFFGGQGFILQRLSGQGDVLVKGGGTIVCKELEEGESLRVTSGSIVAFEPTVSYDVQMMQGVKNAMFGGEGLFVTLLQGPGRVWLQGMPPDRMIAEIASRVPSGGLGLGIPIGMGGGTGGDSSGAAGDAGGEGGEDATDGIGGGEEMMAASDAAIDADRQATVATSGGMSSPSDGVDSDSQSALFGDTVSSDEKEGGSSNADDFGDDASWASSSEETSFTDTNDESFGTEEPTFKDEGFFGEDSSSTTEGLGETATDADEGGGIVSTLWDFFMGGDE